MKVYFVGEDGLDAGGLTREWFTLVLSEMIRPEFGLFVSDPTNDRRYSVSPTAALAQPEAGFYFEFLGRLLGKALLDSIPAPIRFTQLFYKLLLGLPPHISDLATVDPQLYAQLSRMKTDDVRAYGTTFVVTKDHFGEMVEEELAPGGSDIELTNENKEYYAGLRAHERMFGTTTLHQQIIVDAFHEVIPLRICRSSELTPAQLELLMCGRPTIDADNWEAYTRYENGLNRNSQVVQWFWEIVREMDPEKQQQLLYFATGSHIPPAEGFEYLTDSSAQPCPFTISKLDVSCDDYLPIAHTCANQIDLPEYSSKDTFRRKLFESLTYAKLGNFRI
jgi:E3 ubiquitin-protein ligase HUWE1